LRRAMWHAVLRLASAVLLVSLHGSGGETDQGRLAVLQWNPHWECFVKSSNCTHQAESTLEGLLLNTELDLDFANIVELEDQSYIAPSGWAMLNSTAKRDVTTLFYNSERWTPIAASGAHQAGCMVAQDRPYVVQAFAHNRRGFSVIVVGAHFPHVLSIYGGMKVLGAAIKSVINATGVTAIVLAADTNMDRHLPYGSSGGLMKLLGVPAVEHIVSTDLLKTCCLNDGFHFTFDRVIANFGMDMNTSMLFDPTPAWAFGEFHRAVIGTWAVPALNSQWFVELI